MWRLGTLCDIYKYRDFVCLNQILINWLYTFPSTMLIKEYETPEEAKSSKFMKLVFHTYKGRRGCIQEESVCDTHGTHESIMQTSHFVCIKPPLRSWPVPNKTIIIQPESFGNAGIAGLLLRAMKPKFSSHHPIQPKCRGICPKVIHIYKLVSSFTLGLNYIIELPIMLPTSILFQSKVGLNLRVLRKPC